MTILTCYELDYYELLEAIAKERELGKRLRLLEGLMDGRRS